MFILEQIPCNQCLRIHLDPVYSKNEISKSDFIYLDNLMKNIMEKLERKLFFYAEKKCIRYWELLETNHGIQTDPVDRLNVVIFLRVQDMNKAVQKQRKLKNSRDTEKISKEIERALSLVEVFRVHIGRISNERLRTCLDDLSYCILFCIENALFDLGKKNLVLYGDLCCSYIGLRHEQFYDLYDRLSESRLSC